MTTQPTNTYNTYYLAVTFADGTSRSFIASPVVAISVESALADISEAYGQRAELLKDYTSDIASLN